MDSRDARPDLEVLADVVRRGTQLAIAQRRRRRLFGGAAVIAAVGLIGGLVVAQRGDGPPEQVTSVASSSVPDKPAAAVDPGFELRETVDPKSEDKPPAVRIGNADQLLELNPWTTCWSGTGNGYCSDGASPTDLKRIEGADELYVEFPVEGWEFESSAVLGARGSQCGGRFVQPLEQVGPTLFRLPPMGEPGDYTVDVFGRGEGGDVVVSFGWTTDVTGSFTKPVSTLTLLAEHDGAVDSYGAEFSVINLERTPTDVAAQVTVTASNGTSHVIQLSPRGEPCAEGAIDLTAPIQEGLAAAALGDPPFTYDVRLSFDGTTYEATAKWPDDVDEQCDPCVPLVFDPPLPGLGD